MAMLLPIFTWVVIQRGMEPFKNALCEDLTKDTNTFAKDLKEWEENDDI